VRKKRKRGSFCTRSSQNRREETKRPRRGKRETDTSWANYHLLSNKLEVVRGGGRGGKKPKKRRGGVKKSRISLFGVQKNQRKENQGIGGKRA